MSQQSKYGTYHCIGLLIVEINAQQHYVGIDLTHQEARTALFYAQDQKELFDFINSEYHGKWRIYAQYNDQNESFSWVGA